MEAMVALQLRHHHKVNIRGPADMWRSKDGKSNNAIRAVGHRVHLFCGRWSIDAWCGAHGHGAVVAMDAMVLVQLHHRHRDNIRGPPDTRQPKGGKSINVIRDASRRAHLAVVRWSIDAWRGAHLACGYNSDGRHGSSAASTPSH